MLGSTSADDDRDDPAEALMREVGAQLRAVRLERGEDLDEVARHLRIKPAYLFGIEQGDLSALPGRTYALGFLRTYADHLGFDGADLVARLKSSVGDLSDRTRLRIRAPMPENRLPRTPMVAISLALVAGIYLGWSYVNRTSRTAMDTVAEVPDDLRTPGAVAAPEDRPAPEAPTRLAARSDGEALAGAQPESAGAPGAAPVAAPDSGSSGALAARSGPAAGDPLPGASDAAAEPTASAPQPETASADDRLAQSERAALSLQPAAGAAPPAAPRSGPTGAEPDAQDAVAAASLAGAGTGAGGRTEAGDTAGERAAEEVGPARQAVARLLAPAAGGAGRARVFERTNTDARVILRAREASWVQVSSRAGDYTFTRTLEPGEAVLLPNRGDLVLWTGNAHGLEVMVDGAPVALAPGPMVRRNIPLDPDRLSAASEASR